MGGNRSTHVGDFEVDRVSELAAAGEGASFAPAGKVFKEWMLVEERDAEAWLAMMAEACDFVRAKS